MSEKVEIEATEEVKFVPTIWTKELEAELLGMLSKFGAAMFQAFNLNTDVQEVENIRAFMVDRFGPIWKEIGVTSFDRYVEAKGMTTRIKAKAGKPAGPKVNLYAARD